MLPQPPFLTTTPILNYNKSFVTTQLKAVNMPFDLILEKYPILSVDQKWNSWEDDGVRWVLADKLSLITCLNNLIQELKLTWAEWKYIRDTRLRVKYSWFLGMCLVSCVWVSLTLDHDALCSLKEQILSLIEIVVEGSRRSLHYGLIISKANSLFLLS